MFDTMTMTKVLGAVCGSLLLFLLGKFAAEGIYHSGGGHGDDHQQAYVIEVEGDDEEPEVEEVIDMVAMVAAMEPTQGEKVFNKCKACHKLDGTDGTGPHLNGVVDRQIAVVDGFGYSGILVEKASEAWTIENLSAFLENPKGWAPGTKMSFSGLRKPDDRAAVIAYLAATE